MTNLESIQENTSEFNISFHLRQSIAEDCIVLEAELIVNEVTE